MAASQYCYRRAWEKMENNRVGGEELLVVGDDKGGSKVYGSNLCQRHKNQTEAPAGKLMPNSIPEKPWRHISANFIVKLPLAQGYNAILVVCNCLAKMAHFIPLTEKTSAEGLA